MKVDVPVEAVKTVYNLIIEASTSPYLQRMLGLSKEATIATVQAALVAHVEIMRRHAGPEKFAGYVEAVRELVIAVETQVASVGEA